MKVSFSKPILISLCILLIYPIAVLAWARQTIEFGYVRYPFFVNVMMYAGLLLHAYLFCGMLKDTYDYSLCVLLEEDRLKIYRFIFLSKILDLKRVQFITEEDMNLLLAEEKRRGICFMFDNGEKLSFRFFRSKITQWNNLTILIDIANQHINQKRVASL